MGRLAKAPMTKQAMQEEAAVAVMRDFFVVACRHQLGQCYLWASAEQGLGERGCQLVSLQLWAISMIITQQLQSCAELICGACRQANRCLHCSPGSRHSLGCHCH